MQSLRAGLALAILCATPAWAQDALVKSARAAMTSADGAALGTLVLNTAPVGVIIQGELQGLPTSPRGFHVHATGACEPPFESAGGHSIPPRPSTASSARPARRRRHTNFNVGQAAFDGA